jgi:nucleotide-binding universal stress UspA family protein
MWRASYNKEDTMKILVGYDGSGVAEDVLKLAHKHAKAFKADIWVMTSLAQSPTLKKEDIDKAESRLERSRIPFRADNIPCEINVSVSPYSAGEDLVKYANYNDFDEIIIGVRRKSKVGKLMFGSTAQYVILKATCPVVSVK